MSSTVVRALTGTRERPVLSFRRSYRATAADVRQACTDVERLARWFGRVEGDPTGVGDAFTVRLGHEESDAAACRVLRCTDDVVAVSWAWTGETASVLTARVEPDDGTTGLTVLTLRHELVEPGEAVAYGGGWEQMLQTLAGALSGREGEHAAGRVEAHGAAGDVEAEAVTRWRAMARAPLETEALVAAPVEDVWRAWSSAASVAGWWWRHWDDVEIAADVRVGGRYRFAAPRAGLTVEGEYLAVDAPHRLAFTWRWLDDDPTVPDEAVEVRLVPDGDGTRVLVRHTGPWADDAPAASYRQGWASVLDQLAVRLGPGR